MKIVKKFDNQLSLVEQKAYVEGSFYFFCGEISKSIEALRECIKISQERNFTFFTKLAKTILARFLRLSGQGKESFQLSKDVYDSVDINQFPFSASLLLADLAFGYYITGKGDKNKIKKLFDMSMQLTSHPLSSAFACYTRVDYAKYLVEIGEIEKGKKIFNESIDKPSGQKNLSRPDALLGLGNIAIIENARGQTGQTDI